MERAGETPPVLRLSPCGESGLKYGCCIQYTKNNGSLPMRGEWIEMKAVKARICATRSLPMRGEWIEMNCSAVRVPMARSLPMRGEWIEM